MKLDNVLTEIDETLKNQPLPKRVRETLMKIREDLVKEEHELAVRITSAVYELEDIANDVNIPMHAKTTLWDIISDLEALKQE